MIPARAARIVNSKLIQESRNACLVVGAVQKIAMVISILLFSFFAVCVNVRMSVMVSRFPGDGGTIIYLTVEKFF
jgi:hypothetical protein